MRPLLILVSALASIIACQPGKSQPEEVSSDVTPSAPEATPSGPKISSTLLFQDLEQYKEEMEAYHAGLLWYQSRQEWDSLFRKAKTDLNEGADLITFFQALARINTNIKCGHTRIGLGRNDMDSWKDTLQVFPYHVTVIDQRLYVDRRSNRQNQLQPGDEIISINGSSVQSILAQMLPHIAMDGFNQTGKYRYISGRFPLLYSLLIDATARDYKITFKNAANGSTQQISAAGISFYDYENTRTLNDESLLIFNRIEGLEKSHYLKIKTFSSSWMRSSGLDYFRFLKTSFEQLKNAGGQNLIIDLRGNGGGDDGNGSRLLSYLLDEPFGYYKSIEVTPNYSGWGNVRKKGDSYYITSHDDIGQHQPSNSAFGGKVIILIDGGSFSATSEFAALMHDHKRATFVGVETGGGYYGNTSGNRRRITLDNTQISASIPYWRYLVDVEGNEFYGKGVVPDHLVDIDPQDLATGRDTMLEYAKSLIARNID